MGTKNICSCAPSLGTPLAVLGTLFHLVFVQNRGTVIIPFTTRTMLLEVSVRISMSDAKNVAIRNKTCDMMCYSPERANNSIIDINNMIKMGVMEYMGHPPWQHELTTGNPFVSTNGLIEGGFGNLLPSLISVLVLWTVIFFLLLTYAVCQTFCCGDGSGYFDVRSGAYLQFTYTMASQTWYKTMIGLLLAISGVSFVLFILFVAFTDGRDFVTKSLGSSVVDVLAWLYGVHQLKQATLVTFEWEDDDFGNIRFKRPFSFFILANREYTEKLQAALVHSERHKSHGDDQYIKLFLFGSTATANKSRIVLMRALDKDHFDPRHQDSLLWFEKYAERIRGMLGYASIDDDDEEEDSADDENERSSASEYEAMKTS